jgi:regulator of protease activity HflC (stomatin/prohibitin superfamily)
MGTKEFIKKLSMKSNGFLHLLLNVVLFVLMFLSIITFANDESLTFYLVAFLVLMVTWFIHVIGFVLIQPNMSIVLTFFGVYSGTIKENGFFWINPLYGKRKLSLRALNMDVEPIKVNDKNGNPIMIGLVLVWKIEDTYKACFDIDSTSGSSGTKSVSLKSFEHFVQIQSDAALRKVAGLYAYDHIDHKVEEMTLRSGGEEINDRLEEELMERLAIAGIAVKEARINYLAYASEIAGAMLRRQQAEAIIAAREKIVEGAVSMVELALNKLEENHVVNLDEDKKATMVSNLLVVLCADEAARPVINTGSIY